MAIARRGRARWALGRWQWGWGGGLGERGEPAGRRRLARSAVGTRRSCPANEPCRRPCASEGIPGQGSGDSARRATRRRCERSGRGNGQERAWRARVGPRCARVELPVGRKARRRRRVKDRGRLPDEAARGERDQGAGHRDGMGSEGLLAEGVPIRPEETDPGIAPRIPGYGPHCTSQAARSAALMPTLPPSSETRKVLRSSAWGSQRGLEPRGRRLAVPAEPRTHAPVSSVRAEGDPRIEQE